MDAFYASVEQRDNPNYKNLPLIVGGRSNRGVVSAASYEARKFGIHSAMPVSVAMRKCPGLINLPPRIDYYREVSEQIHEVFYEFTDWVEPLSLDEAFLDVSIDKKQVKSAIRIAQEIRRLIFERTKLTASAGISYNKFLAKIASDYNKPNGQFAILPGNAAEVLETLPVEKFFGIGKVTAEKMRKMGILSGKELKEKELHFLVNHFGKSGAYYYEIVRGIDERPVEPFRERKSIGAERTFIEDVLDKNRLERALLAITEIAFDRLQRKKRRAKTVCLKIKFEDFVQITRSKTLTQEIGDIESVKRIAVDLFRNEIIEKKVRLMGLSFSNLNDDSLPHQLKLPFVD